MAHPTKSLIARAQELRNALTNDQKIPAAELVAFWNGNAQNYIENSRLIKRFGTAADARRRILALCDAIETVAASAQPAPAASKRTISDGVRASWADPAVRAARSERTRVKVGGETFRSVAAAFTALGFDMRKHIAFRIALKAAGRATFDGKIFTVVAAEAPAAA